MSRLTTYSKAVAVSVLAGAALGIVPAVAVARAPSAPYRQPIEFAMPAPPRAQPLPPVARGTTVVLPSDPELDRFEKELAGG
jgi:hypothetical protein